MDQRCATCFRKIRSPASTSPFVVAPSLDTTSTATNALKDFQLQSLFQNLETDSSTHQNAQSLRDIDEFQVVGLRHELPNPADSWFRPAQFSTDSYVATDDNFDREHYCLDVPEYHRPGDRKTNEPLPLKFSRPETISSGEFRCYQHGCKGRQFSSSENYRRHIRERSRSDKTACPFCAAVFTRKSNKDTHISKGRCKSLNRLLFEQVTIHSNEEASFEGMCDSADTGQALVGGDAAGQGI